ncbi:Protein cobra [Rhynchospora pubera]|uniref:Protein cobra n=1 Tax=Rhynchospora pubera TaxID=906938 RepID=A0AAV8G4Y5_9POAL|nr:Protein cobra [Rhynchospora pubera]
MELENGSFLSKVLTPWALCLILLSCLSYSEAYDSLDPNGNITIKWDFMSWTPDGYVAVVTMYNYQQCRHIQPPGWQLSWTWAKKEVIWSMEGALVTEQGNTKKTVTVPKNFILKAPGPGYTCGPAKLVESTKLVNGRRTTEALMTWSLTCTYSQFLAQKVPSCCVSLSSFYNDTVVDCPTCSCGCQNSNTKHRNCVKGDSPHLRSILNGPGKYSYTPLVQCTSHMCPIRVHWHVMLNNKDYWRVKITITNLNYRMNYTQWNLAVQHPNFDNLATLVDLNYKSLMPYGAGINDIAMLWGVKNNDLLMTAGSYGNVQAELLFRKDSNTFISEKGWEFPRRVYFNGDNCVMPPPDAYPWVPNEELL